MKFPLFRKPKTDVTKLQQQVTENVIKAAYQKRFKEIESLRLYDRGEKTISTSNIKARLRSV